jgi:hypothetical protein
MSQLPCVQKYVLARKAGFGGGNGGYLFSHRFTFCHALEQFLHLPDTHPFGDESGDRGMRQKTRSCRSNLVNFHPWIHPGALADRSLLSYPYIFIYIYILQANVMI